MYYCFKHIFLDSDRNYQVQKITTPYYDEGYQLLHDILQGKVRTSRGVSYKKMMYVKSTILTTSSDMEPVYEERDMRAEIKAWREEQLNHVFLGMQAIEMMQEAGHAA